MSVLAALALVLAVGAAHAAELAGWDRTRWGMDVGDLERLYGSRLEILDPPLRYGGAYVDRALAGVDMGGFAYVAQLQMGAATHRLQQVMLERRAVGATPAAFAAALGALTAAYGPPTRSCDSPQAVSPISRERVWRLGPTTAHLVFLAFGSGALLYDPSLDIDPLFPEYKERLYSPRGFPRRLLIRFHPTARADLMGKACPVQGG